MKTFAKKAIADLVFRAPWGVREAMLDGYLRRVGVNDLRARVLPAFNIVEVASTGDRGIVTSVWNDTYVLPEYGETGTFAPFVAKALLDFFRDGPGTYLDIGANIGLMTIPVARNPHVHCFAFEPEPINFDLLRRNVLRNAPQGNVSFQNVALFHSRGSLSLAVAERNIGDHRLTTGEISGRETVRVAAVPLDDYLDQIVGPVAAKIDTQGAEPFIIAGGQKVLERVGLLAMEFCPFLMRQLGGDPEIVIDLVDSFGEVAIMSGGKAETPNFLPPAEAGKILRRKLATADDTDSDYLDILARRGGG